VERYGEIMETDDLVLSTMHLALGLLFGVSLMGDLVWKWKELHGTARGRALRGETSMAAINGTFAFFGLLFAAFVQEAQSLVGNRLIVLTLDWFVLAYLFYGCSWFRNCIFMRLRKRVQVD